MKKIILILCIINNSISFLHAQSGWVQTSTQSIGEVSNIAILGADIFTINYGQLYLSTDNGVTWGLRTGVPSISSITSLITDGSSLFVATGFIGAAVYKSSDLGLTWTNISPAFPFSDDAAETLLIDQGNIYVGMYFAGIYKAGLAGINANSWTEFNNGLPIFIPPYFPTIKSLNILGPLIIAGTYGHGVWISPTNSPNWSATSGMLAGANYISPVSIDGPVVLAGNISGTPVLYRSIDSGRNWNPVNSIVFLDQPLNTLISNSDTIFAGSTNGVLISIDNGLTWSEYNDGLKDGSGNWVGNGNQQYVNALLINGGTIYAGTGDGVWTRSLLVTLPVKLVSFDVSYKNGAAYLNWKTATESNLNKFEIEKSFDGGNFKKIGEVKAVGNSSLTQLYNYVDHNIDAVYSGNIFFRLRQVDFDGKFSYSPVTSIKIKHGLQQMQVYPNPATDLVNLQVSLLQIGLPYRVSNAAGQKVLSGKLLTIKTLIDIRNLKAGAYFLQIEGKDNEAIKFLKK